MLALNGFEYNKLTAKTVSFSDLARGSALFVTARGFRDAASHVHRIEITALPRWHEAKGSCRTAGFKVKGTVLRALV